ncbi:uncharacterized protein TNCV_2214931 [Trichonephila clavipes]|nr:uncharacterized protein TNCV_2214931 [Trichonephila clavipes]
MGEIDGLGILLRSLWPTLHCRRVTGVNPLLSIGWWYLSLVSPKRHCYRVSAADKGCRVYPLDPRPDAVALYYGCTPGKRRAWFLPDDRTLPPLVGGGKPERRSYAYLWIQCCCARPVTLTAEFARTFRILCAVLSARGSDIRKHPAAVNRHALDMRQLDILLLTAF